MGAATWTEEQKQRIAILLVDGKSASQIGGEIGISKGAIISLVHRNPALKAIGFARPATRLTGGKKQTLPRKEPNRLPGRRGKKVATERILYSNEPIHAAGLPLARLTAHMCRFPVNDAARGEQHLFCGSEAEGNWCARHLARVYYHPPETRTRACGS